MATNVINIREFVDVSTTVATTPANVERDWASVLFVQKGEAGAVTKATKYDTLNDLISALGSNTAAAKFATQFYQTEYGIAPNSPVWVATIDASTSELFASNFTSLLTSEDYYLVAIDAAFTVAENKTAASLANAANTTTAHKLFLVDKSADAFDKTLEEDTDSLSAYCANNDFNHVIVTAVNPSNTNPYYQAANMAFWATRQFNASSRQMASLANKPASGIAPVDMTDPQLDASVLPTQKFKNLDSKNANVYINVKLIGLPAWERGNLPSGNDISEYISADYLNYTITMAVFQLLQSVPRVPMNRDGATMLANTISGAFAELRTAGVIGGGTSLDGEVFSDLGYKISIPTPTGVKKANGLWDGIVCSALLQGSAKKVVIGNDLKK